MTTATIDPLQSHVLSIIRTAPSTTEEVHRRLVDGGDAVPQRRLSAILHGLRASGRITLRRHCDVYKSRLPVRQEWRIP